MATDDQTTLTVKVTFQRESGEVRSDDDLIDYFAAMIGRQNTARPPLTLRFDDDDGESVYVVEEVDAA